MPKYTQDSIRESKYTQKHTKENYIMSDSNPFKIRLELLHMAKDLLMDEYHTKKEVMLEQWREAKDKTSPDGRLPAYPEYPPYPTELDILRKASILNDFISKSK
jgi:hypothetical protein